MSRERPSWCSHKECQPVYSIKDVCVGCLSEHPHCRNSSYCLCFAHQPSIALRSLDVLRLLSCLEKVTQFEETLPNGLAQAN